MPDPLSPIGLSLIAVTLPLLGSVLSALCGAARLPRLAHMPAVLTFAAAGVISGYVLFTLAGGKDPLSYKAELGTWFTVGDMKVPVAFHLDSLSLIMLSTVTFIATFIAVFSASYMKGDDGFARYFAVMGLFVFAMCLLVTSNNFFLLVAGWEGVGLCSYLLVGYYYTKPSAAAAARKAFLVTRLGDVGMILGIFWLWKFGGYHSNIDQLVDHITHQPPAADQITLCCLLLFCGAVGKSAQLPLYVWLPDAMEGPTPVSALIHAATMVTAGVYLLARTAPLFALSPTAQIVVTIVGGLTALLAAFIALAQYDLKRVLAYSTVSQLGFMFMGLGCGGAIAPNIAVTAAIFHLFTHAFFKALLFLGSGSVMHAMGNVIDMRKFGGLRKLMPVTHATFLIGSLALAGFPLLSGFWSKDQILTALHDAGTGRSVFHGYYYTVYLVACLTALMTAFYTFRAYFLTFWGEERVPHEAHGHAHESSPAMTIPLVILAVGALAIGAVVDPLTHWFGHFLERSPVLHHADEAFHKTTNMSVGHHAFNVTVAAISSVLSLAGIGIAAMLYRKGGPEKVPTVLKPVFALSQNKAYVDEVYGATVVLPAETAASGSGQFDGFLDALARLISFIPRFLGAVLRPLQNGLVQFYALGMVLGLAVFLTVVVLRSGR
ncbi:MAG: NADH-quinone oxidoreductase subunit L [Fimbriiglobus sp.]|nr:NADH-quinone oxidoreductase subunit L [Fimbriiglobus sp.]